MSRDPTDPTLMTLNPSGLIDQGGSSSGSGLIRRDGVGGEPGSAANIQRKLLEMPVGPGVGQVSLFLSKCFIDLFTEEITPSCSSQPN